jgi:hypothetical protein
MVEPMSRARFNQLVRRWHRDTKCWANPRDIIAHSAYQAIISEGPAFLPLIFALMRRGGLGYWHNALCIITGENPIPDDFPGTPMEMCARWLQWAQDHKY